MASGVGHNIKWLSAVSVWLFLAMLGVLVTAKVCLLWLLRLYKYEQIHPATWYIIVCFLLELPHLCNLFYILWNTPFISSARKEELPRPAQLYLGLVSSVMEGIAVSIFASEVSVVLPEPVFLCLPGAVFTITLIVSTCKKLQLKYKTKVKTEKKLCTGVIYCMGVIMSSFNLWAPAAISVIIYLWSPFNMNLQQCISLPIVLLVLSTSWSRKIQKLSICSSKQNKRNLIAALSYTIIKLCTIPVTLLGFMAFKMETFRKDMGEFLLKGFTNSNDYRIWLPVAIAFICGMIAVLLTDAACKVSLTTPGVRLPTLLTPLTTFVITIILWGDVSTDAIWELSGSDVISWTASALAICIWLVPFIIPGVEIIKAPSALLRPFSENFFNFSWNQMFLEQSLILNFNHKGIGSISSGLDSINKKAGCKHVFICTTMFRENKAEMSRYLISLQKLLKSEKLHDIKVESHIFLDNAMDCDSLNSYACQLLSLLVDTFNITLSSLVAYRTPYGCQILSHPKPDFPVYVHVKDGSKFKVKKRWSQVMYMNYILKYRCSFELDDSGHVKDFAYDNKDVVLEGYKTAKVKIVKGTPYSYPLAYQNAGNEIRPEQIIITGVEDEDSGSEGSSSSTSGSEAYTVSRESNNSCQTSESTDSDDSELFLFKTFPGRNKNQLAVPCSRGTKRHVLGANLNNIHNGMEKHKLVWSKRKAVYLPNGDKIEITNRETEDVFTVSGAQLDEPVYILATDADTEFNAKSVSALVELCERDHSLGAACGRTIPIGHQKPMVWYQKFEYAKDFWLVKASQNIIGSVTCCPGCFSLYRARALADVLQTFQEPSNTAFDALVKDHGEDRWLCTLMMLRGWKLEYIDHCRNSTHCPETFMEFLGQRRRWVLSELSNMVLIFKNLRSLVRSNAAFSTVFILSLLQMFLWVLISPSTTLLIMFVACEAIFGLPLVWSVPISFLVFVVYCILCCVGSVKIQKIATWAMLCLSIILMITVSVGFVYFMTKSIMEDVKDGYVEFRPYFLIPLLIGGVVYAALIHPGEWLNLIYGLIYAVLFPAMFIILPIYAVANIVDQSWGTRELPKNTDKPSKKINSSSSIEDLVGENGEGNTSDVTIIRPKNLQMLADTGSDKLKAESRFWELLQSTILGTEVNIGKDTETLKNRLYVLRNRCVFAMVLLNTVWFSMLTAIYLIIDTDVICYILAGIFSFSLLVQLVGMTSYKIDNVLRRYVLRRLCSSQPTWIKARH